MKAKPQMSNKTPQKAQKQSSNKTPQKAKIQQSKNVRSSNKMHPKLYKEVMVIMPNLPTHSEVLQDLMKHCETMRLSFHGLAVILGLAPDKADETVKKLSDLEYNGHKLKMVVMYDRSIEPLLKKIALRVKHMEAKLKAHYNATHVECPKGSSTPFSLYLLHFSSKAAADEAMKKSIEINGRILTLRNCYVRNDAEKRNAPQNGSPAKKLKTNKKEAKSQVCVEDDEEEDEDEDEAEDEEEDDEAEDEEEDDEAEDEEEDDEAEDDEDDE